MKEPKETKGELFPRVDFLVSIFWLNKLNQFGGDYETAEIVKAFLESLEYRNRFGATAFSVTLKRCNRDCNGYSDA